MTEPIGRDEFVRPAPETRYACGALVQGTVPMSAAQRRRSGVFLGTNTTYRCRIVPSGQTGVGCCADHTAQIVAERRLREAIENAHRSGVAAQKGWEPAEVRPSRVDTHRAYIGADPDSVARRAAAFGVLRPEVEAWELERKSARRSIYAPGAAHAGAERSWWT
jgi:hypothetical protein